MKVLLGIFLAAFALTSSAATKKLGIGAMVGNPTGLNGKYWLGGNKAVDAGLGISLGKHSEVNLHSDYLFHKSDAFYFNEVHPLDFYYGIGGRMEFADTIELGVRLPLGLVHEFKAEAADLFGEVAPVVDFIGKTGLEISLAVGARYYF